MNSSHASMPSASFGYWRGGGSEIPLAGGQGSGMGQANSGLGKLAQGIGVAGGGGQGGQWTPSVIFLLGLTVAEMIVFALVARALR